MDLKLQIGDMMGINQQNALLTGAISPGLGKGSYYLSFPEYQKQIKKKLGFVAYNGTLNVCLSSSESAKKSSLLKNFKPIIIKGFKKGQKTFGDVFAYLCRIEKIKCAIVVPLCTHHLPEIIEIISSVNLREALGKKDGNKIKIIF